MIIKILKYQTLLGLIILIGKKKYAVVVAHPDDEILFAASIIEKASKVIICFSNVPFEREIDVILSRGRKNVIKRYPLNNFKFLEIPQASNRGANKNNWDNVVENKYGVFGGRNFEEYKQNFNKIYDNLKIELKNFDSVYTHNPWGEYGHVEHIQVHRCIAKLKDSLGFKMYVFGYTSRDTINFSTIKLNHLSTEPLRIKNNRQLFFDIKKLYIQEKCWTWSDFHTPPMVEFFFEYRGLKKSSLNNKKIKISLNYIYHPIYSRRVRCFEYKTDSIFFKLFSLQNKYLFRLRQIFVDTFLRPLIKVISS